MIHACCRGEVIEETEEEEEEKAGLLQETAGKVLQAPREVLRGFGLVASNITQVG